MRRVRPAAQGDVLMRFTALNKISYADLRPLIAKEVLTRNSLMSDYEYGGDD